MADVVLGIASNCETFTIGLPIIQNNKPIVKREKRLRDISFSSSSSEDECVQPGHTVNHKLLESGNSDVSEESFLEVSSDSDDADETNIKEM